MLILVSILIVGALVLGGVLIAQSPGRVEPYRDANGSTLPNSISEKITVNIGGVEQGMFIRGKDTRNPVLLFVHGGPGMPEFFLADSNSTGLEDKFTVCYWEQRGAGLSYHAGMAAESITAEQLVNDAIDVTNYLRQRFGQDKIYLLAHSWGTFLGIQAAKKAPELYRAYIGVAQISDMRKSERLAYQYMLKQYAALGNTGMIDKLNKYPILESDETLRAFFVSMLRDDAMHQLGIGTTHTMKSVVSGVFLPVMQCKAYTLGEKINLWKAKAFLRNETGLIDSLLAADLPAEVPQLEIPAYFMSGDYDYTVNRDLAKAYLDGLQAPVKGFYSFAQSAHSPMFEEPEAFVKVMVEDVLQGKTGLAD